MKSFVRLAVIGLFAYMPLSAAPETQVIDFDQGKVDIPTVIKIAKEIAVPVTPNPAAIGPTSEQSAEHQSALAITQVMSACPKDVRSAFLEQITFIDGKLAGAYIADIRKCMADQEMTALFSYLGVQAKEFLKEYRCKARGDCEKNSTHACTSNCVSASKTGAEPMPLMNAMGKCSKKLAEDFRDSLTFVNGKLAGAYIGGISKCMDTKEIESIFSYLGVGQKDFLRGYKCAARGDCKKDEAHACTSNCRSSN